MKKFGGWWLPDHEQHLPQWLSKVNETVDGRLAYQNKKLTTALSFCRQFRNAIDIGAHCGLISFHITKRFNHTFAFEPVEEHRDCFLQNVGGDYTLFKCALGSQNGFCSTQTTGGSSGDTHIVLDGAGTVQMHPLDEFGLHDIDFIKIDCEGTESLVIQGGLKTIMRDRPIILCEAKGHDAKYYNFEKDSAIKLLRSMGMKDLCPPMSGDWIMGW